MGGSGGGGIKLESLRSRIYMVRPAMYVGQRRISLSTAASGIVRASSVHFGLHPSPRGNHFWQTSNINNRIAPRPSRDLSRR